MNKKRIISIIVMAIGLVTLVTGAVFLILKLNAGPAMADGEYLVTAGSWILDDKSNCTEARADETQTEVEEGTVESEPVDGEKNCMGNSGVIWNFTEIGKGTLTTNRHLNDYSFVWALEDDRMTIQTDWLYELDNEYDYKLDQSSGTLILSDGENEYQFVAQSE